jgi:hypothetical protein
MESGDRHQRLNVDKDDLARQWLRENGYADVAAMIDKIMDQWKAEGKRTRRNWWEMLAGDHQGRPRRLGRHEFPVLESVQIRQGLPVTSNAIRREEEKQAPPKPRVTARWPKAGRSPRPRRAKRN